MLPAGTVRSTSGYPLLSSSPSIVTDCVMAGKADSTLIVWIPDVPRLNVIRFVWAVSPFELAIACRRLPGPPSLVLFTTYVDNSCRVSSNSTDGCRRRVREILVGLRRLEFAVMASFLIA